MKKLKYIYGQPASIRFKWELDVALTNLYSLDEDADVVILFTRDGPDSERVFDHIVRRYPKAEVHMYEDLRNDKTYPANTRPYLWYCYLSEDPSREKDTYFQVESDVIFRQLPDYSKIPFSKNRWFASDCSGYIAYDPYIKQVQQADLIMNGFASITGVPRKQLEEVAGVGAHWIMVQPTAEYWLGVYQNSNRLFHFLEPIDSNIQKWTAEMWAQLYSALPLGVKWQAHPELDFCNATDNIKLYEQVNIMHNAGVIGEAGKTMFYKGKYFDHEPFHEDLSWVIKHKATAKYVEAIKAVML